MKIKGTYSVGGKDKQFCYKGNSDLSDTEETIREQMAEVANGIINQERVDGDGVVAFTPRIKPA